MKKAFDQTVRDLKREVNKKVRKVPGIEQKVLDATSNESWGPHGSLLADIAQATRNYHEYQRIMNVIWKRINDTGKNWRHVYKALMVLEYLVANGSEHVIDNIKEHSYHISALSNFQYIDSSGRDQGSNIRRKSQILVALVNDREKIQEFRQKNSANRDMHRGSAGRPGRYSDNNDDYYENRYASRDEDPYGNRNKREVGHRDRGDDRGNGAGVQYGREGERNSGYADEHDNDNAERYSSGGGGGGGGADNYPREQGQLGQRLSDASVGAPPSYEEATRDVEIYVHDDRNGDDLVTAAPKVSSPSAPKSNSLSESTDQVSVPFATIDRFPASTNQGLDHPPDDVFFSTNQDENNGFDEFDPRDSSVSADPPVADSLEMGIFGPSSASDIYSLALTSSSATHNGAEVDCPANSGVGPDFGMMSSAADVFAQPGSNPFEDPPFVASQHSFDPEQNTATGTHFHSSSSTGGSEYPLPLVPKTETTGFDFDLSFGISYNPVLDGQQSSHTNAGILIPSVTQLNHDISATLTGKDAALSIHESRSVAPTNVQGNFQHQSGNSFGFSYNPALDGQLGSFASPANFTPEAPVSQQSNDFSAMLTGLQASVPTQGFQPVPLTHVQVNPQPQSGTPAPSASQATQYPTFNAHPGTPSNNHIAQMDNLSQLGLQITPAVTPHLQQNSDSQPQSAPFASQLTPSTTLDAHTITPVNNQTTQMETFSQYGQQIPPAAPTYGTENLNPRPQSVPAPFALQSTPFTTLEPHLITPVNNQSTQLNIFSQCPPTAPTNAQGNLMSHSSIPSQFASQTTTPVNNLTNQQNTFLQPGQQTQPTMDLALALVVPPVKDAPSKEKFEAKSRVWADTLSRGLVNLDISGPKTNPHADIGIDFDSMNRKEKREEKKLTAAPVSTITMGKAMGTGSGIGRAGAGVMSGPPNIMMGMGMMGGAGVGIGPMGGGPGMGIGPMGGGLGMGISPMGGGAGMGMRMGMGGYGGNMGQPMGMGMNPGMNQGMPARPPLMGTLPPGQGGTPGFGYNPINGGMGNYGSQQPYGGAYR
ncbi:clathrin interactor EPSIN 3-like [Zingiber officinale]|uniref:clathrin interactor EPSIN 3-like n=1 Tax=Zingiber officinale TaxID=94328 RepID=UPI001C4A83A3|nr:clathrin interactor EPSIN 3-like [Zingiber officinale]XP_042377813.1 clathrin interactor EPSIN 3-like [Zingiber officinale]